MSDNPKPRFQFSLVQLICFTLLCATLLYAVLGRETWRLKLKLPGRVHDPQSALTLDDSKIILMQNNAAKIFDTSSGKELLSIPAAVSAVAISEDGRLAAVGTGSGTIEIWSVTDSTKKSEIAAHKSVIESLSFSADGRYLISSSADLVARVWNVDNGSLKADLTGHTGLIQRAYLSADGSTALTQSDHGWGRGIDPADQSKILWGDKTERIWDTRTQQTLKTGTRWSEETPKGRILHDALSPDERMPYPTFHDGTRDGRLQIFRPSYGEPWAVMDNAAQKSIFEFDNCVGRSAHAFFGHNEEITVTCPLETDRPETTIWQHMNSAGYNRLIHWWLVRILAAAAVVYVIHRFFKRRKRLRP